MVCIRFDVVVTFARRRPSAVELMAVRQSDPWLRDKPIGEVRRILEAASKNDWTYRITCAFNADAEVIFAQLNAAGLRVHME